MFVDRPASTDRRQRSQQAVDARLTNFEEDLEEALTAGVVDGEVKDWDAIAAAARQKMDELESSLVRRLRPYDAFDAAANIWFHEIPVDLRSYVESEHQGSLAAVELVCGLLLRRESRPGVQAARYVPGDVVEDVALQARSFLRHRCLEFLARLDRGGGAFSSIRYAQFTKHVLVRNPAYAAQERRLLVDLFGPANVEADLVASVGFSIGDALSLIRVLDELPSRRMAHERSLARGMVKMLQARITGSAAGSSRFDDLVAQLRGLDAPAQAEALDALAVQGMFRALGDKMVTNADQLAELSGVATERVTAFVSRFSNTFGFDGSLIDAASAVRERPLIVDDAGILSIASSDLLFAVRRQLEAALKGKQPRFKRYEKRRKTFLEERSVELLTSAIRPDVAHANLSWTEDGQDFELDGLLLVGSTALSIEAKGGSFANAALRAAPDTLKRDLRKLVTDAQVQGERVRRLLTDHDEFTFRHNDRDVVVDLRAVTAVVTIAVTLEDLSGLGPQTWKLAAAGLLSDTTDGPVVLSLHDLELLVELLDTPTQLLHYLARRLALRQATRLEVTEEADLVSLYLATNLDGASGAEPAILLSQTDDVDRWVYGRDAGETKPAQHVPAALDDLLKALEAARPPGWLDLSCLMLDLPFDARDEFSAQIERVSSAAGVQTLDFSFRVGERGVAVVGGPKGSSFEHAEFLGLLNKYRQRSDWWFSLGLASTATGIEVIHVGSHHAPWSPDAELEALLRSR
jgi:hypothetical protein